MMNFRWYMVSLLMIFSFCKLPQQPASDITLQPPAILTSPENFITMEGMDAYFRVHAEGEQLSFQWQRNSITIAGATDSVLTLISVTLKDDSTFYRCIMSNQSEFDTSGQARLRVLPGDILPPQRCTDTIPPVIRILDGDTVRIALSDPQNELAYYQKKVSAIDNSGVEAIEIDPVICVDIFSVNDIGSPYTITYHFMDTCGNMATALRYVYIFKPTSVDSLLPTIHLNGDSVLVLYFDYGGKVKWNDPGCTVTDAVDGNLTSKVIIDSSELTSNLDKEGTWKVTYSVTNSSGLTAKKNRLVQLIRVISEPSLPVITLLGKNPDTIVVNTAVEYDEPGYTAYHLRDGDLTAKVKITGQVDHGRPGTYTIIYNVTNLSGDPAEVKRIVVVVPRNEVPSSVDY